MTRKAEIKTRLDGLTLDSVDWCAKRAERDFKDNAPSDIEYLLAENTRLREALDLAANRLSFIAGQFKRADMPTDAKNVRGFKKEAREALEASL